MKQIGQKVEDGITIQVYEPAPVKYGLSCKNKTSTKVSRAELSKIQCKGENDAKTN